MREGLVVHDKRDMERLAAAYERARLAHEGQTRKFTGEPYIDHCGLVGSTVGWYHGSIEAIMAGYLHDVIEDTDVSCPEIEEEFGTDVADLVWACTDPPGLRGDARRTAKLKKIQELAADSEARLIQLADIWHNVRSIKDAIEQHGPDIFNEFGAGVGIINYYRIKFDLLAGKTSELKPPLWLAASVTMLTLLAFDQYLKDSYPSLFEELENALQPFDEEAI